MIQRAAAVSAMILVLSPAVAAEPPEDETGEVEEIVVVGRGESLVGVAESASTGRVGAAEIEARPALRAGEILEVIPGLIATQHSGTGKANQFFLRGFNLDHGTDFSSSLEGVPLNLSTHGHGQGYLDLNSVIPELVEVVEFRKGPYHADVGDFSSAGTSSTSYARSLDRSFAKLGVGEDDFYRGVVGLSPRLGSGDLLVAGETKFYDGPWDREENLSHLNGVAKWTTGDDAGGLSLLLSGYWADWDSADQIPRRAVEQGLISRLGSLDRDLGGRTSRFTATGRWWDGAEDPTRVQAYVVFYDFDLWSNFTYFLDDPENGDEFAQFDERTILGLDASQDLGVEIAEVEVANRFGVQLRHDIITDVGLAKSAARERREIVREDEVRITTLGLWWSGEARLVDWMRLIGGLRGDLYWTDVEAISLPENSGNEIDGIVSPKVGVVLGPWASTELYLNYGQGFHSNDARGTTIRVDPASGEPAERVDPLVKSQGAEVGLRTTWIPGLQSTLALWWLELDSELLFVGDAGNTEASRPSQRYGVELANFWRPLEWLTLDADVTFTQSEFTDSDPAGDDIPGAIEHTLAAGAAIDLPVGAFGSLRVRHFGPRPLVEDGSVESDATTLVNLQAGWAFRQVLGGQLDLTLDVLNLFDSTDDDITYFYASRLPGEPAGGIEDEHFHPVEPRTIRGYVTFRY